MFVGNIAYDENDSSLVYIWTESNFEWSINTWWRQHDFGIPLYSHVPCGDPGSYACRIIIRNIGSYGAAGV